MAENPPHVLIFPLPLQGPVNAMLKLADLLCLADLHVTFLLTHQIHSRLIHHSNIQSRFASYPGFQIRVIPSPDGDDTLEVLKGLKTTAKPLLGEILKSNRVSCLVADGILGFTRDVAHDVGIPIFYVRTISAACLWIFFCLPNLIQAGEIPFQGDDLDESIKNVPAMERYLRRRDLPKFCRNRDINDPSIQLFKTEGSEIPRACGLILNTYEELEGPMLSQLAKFCPNIYTIGPLHAHLKVKLAARGTSSKVASSSNSLWQEDPTCITWLDSQPCKSVIYVSFGSVAPIREDQLMEIWHGLVNSGVRFLWVIRPDSIVGKNWEDCLPVELAQGTKARGYIVGWAPQEEVLAHSAIGGFLTHGGWNSIIESIYEGVPMVCWPHFLDQQVNSRLVEEEWRLGLDMKDNCNRSVVEKTVRDLMELRKEEFLQRSKKMANSAKSCLSEDGASHSNLERLINDIRSINF